MIALKFKTTATYKKGDDKDKMSVYREVVYRWPELSNDDVYACWETGRRIVEQAIVSSFKQDLLYSVKDNWSFDTNVEVL